MRKLFRPFDRLLDHFSVRPLGILVFVGSAMALLMLQARQLGRVPARAVASAPPIAQAALLEGTIEEVHVKPGEMVSEGTPLVTLKPRVVQRQLDELDAEILLVEQQHLLALAKLEREQRERREGLSRDLAEANRDVARAKADQSEQWLRQRSTKALLGQISGLLKQRLARSEEKRQAQLNNDLAQAASRSAGLRITAEEIWRDSLKATLDALPEAPGLQQPSVTAYKAQLELLKARRKHLQKDLERRVIVAHASGRVVEVMPLGSPVEIGVVVSRLIPSEASEIIAYLPSEVQPGSVKPGARVAIVEPRGTCSGQTASLLRFGGTVEEAPGQLSALLRRPIYGLPVHISVPAGCALAVGQALTVEIDR